MLIHGYSVSLIATNPGESRQANPIGKGQSVIAFPDIAALIRANITLPRHAPVFQHKARPARLADAVAKIIRGGPRVGADPHLVKRARTAAAHHRGEQA